MLRAMLSEDYEVETLSDGTNAENQAAQYKPDLILLDVLMPGKDGLSVCSDIKANPDTQHIPIILMSAHNTSDDIAAGLAAGADDYLCKPFSTAELKLRVRRRIDASRPSEYIQENIRQLTEQRDAAFPSSYERQRKRIGDTMPPRRYNSRRHKIVWRRARPPRRNGD